MTARRSRAAAWAVAIGLAAAAAIGSCARPVEGPQWQVAQAKRNEITALWTQIRDWRRSARMDVEPAPASVVSMRAASVSAARAVCQDGHKPPAACDDVCDMGDAICDNAESICSIATELGDDPWAKEKCDSAKASCREAKQRCCECEHDAEAAP